MYDGSVIDGHSIFYLPFSVELSDGERMAQLLEEAEAMGQMFKAGTGRDGRARRFPSQQERARQAVSSAIDRAIVSIQKVDPRLAHHLDSSVQRGRVLAYRPAPNRLGSELADSSPLTMSIVMSSARYRLSRCGTGNRAVFGEG